MRYSVAVLLLLISLTVWAEPKPAPPLSCEDFLQQLGLQRADLKLSTCERTENPDPGMDGLQAVYRVEGKDINRVEQWLMNFVHVKPLKFNCCGWETSSEIFTGRDGAKYTMGMGGETIESRREDFAKIPYLKVYVTHYFYDP